MGFEPINESSKVMFYQVVVFFYCSCDCYEYANDEKFSAGFFNSKELAEKYKKTLEDRISDAIKKRAMDAALYDSKTYGGNVDDFYHTELSEIDNQGAYCVYVVEHRYPILFEKESDILDTGDVTLLMNHIQE